MPDQYQTIPYGEDKVLLEHKRIVLLVLKQLLCIQQIEGKKVDSWIEDWYSKLPAGLSHILASEEPLITACGLAGLSRNQEKQYEKGENLQLYLKLRDG